MPELKTVVDALTEFAANLLLLAAPIVAAFLIRWLKAKSDEIIQDLKRGADNTWLLTYGAELAVKAAEQLKLSHQIQDKKAYAIGFVQSYLSNRGVNINVNEIAVAIEAAVYSELNADKKASASSGT